MTNANITAPILAGFAVTTEPGGGWFLAGYRDGITGPGVRRMMRRHGATIRQLAESMGVTMGRVREVRANGTGAHPVVTMDWLEAITGASAQ